MSSTCLWILVVAVAHVTSMMLLTLVQVLGGML